MLWFILGLLFAFQVSGDCNCVQLEADLLAAVIPGNTCTVWTTFLQAQTCNITDFVIAFGLADAYCSSVTWSYTPSSCAENWLVLPACLTINNAAAGKDCTTCFTDYQNYASKLCSAGAQAFQSLSTCITAKALCSAVTCTVDCDSLLDVVDNTTATFNACFSSGSDACPCYLDFTASVNLLSICQAAQGAQLKACVQSQYKCTTTQSTCTTTSVSLAISDVISLVSANIQQYVTILNNALTAAQSIVVNSITYTGGSNTQQLTFTLNINWDPTSTTIDSVCQAIKNALGDCTGLPAAQYTLTVTSNAKRSLQTTTSSIDVVGTGSSSPSSTGSGLSVVMIPILSLMTVIFYYLQ